MPTQSIIRGSSVRLAVLCPASVAPAHDGEVFIDTYDSGGTNEAGTSEHRAIALAIYGDNSAINSLPPDAVERVVRVVDWLAEMKFIEGKETSLCEFNLTEGRLSCTLDFLHVNYTSADIVDFKSTFREDNYEAQLLAQAYVVFCTWPDLETINIYTAYTRKGYTLDKQVSRAFVMAWYDEFVRNVLDHPEIYHPGEHCTRCKRRAGCPGITSMVRQTANELADLAEHDTGYTLVSTPEVAAMWPRVKVLESAIRLYRDYMKTLAEAGPVPLPDGQELRRVSIKKDKISPLAAWHVLQATFIDEELDAFVDIGKTKMLALVADRAKRGEKKKAQDLLMKQLGDVGAVTKVEEFQVRAVAVKESEQP